METRKQLIEGNLKLAEKAATKYTLGAKPSSSSWQEALSAAYEGLVLAAGAWDPSRGVLFTTYAWCAMRNEISRMRQGERRRWDHESPIGPLSKDLSGPLSASPEELLLAAEDRALKSERLSRVGPEGRGAVEAALDGQAFSGKNGSGRLDALALVEEAGIRVPASLAAKIVLSRDSRGRFVRSGAEKLSAKERSRRYYSRLSPERKEARNRKKEDRRKKARLARAA